MSASAIPQLIIIQRATLTSNGTAIAYLPSFRFSGGTAETSSEWAIECLLIREPGFHRDLANSHACAGYKSDTPVATADEGVAVTSLFLIEISRPFVRRTIADRRMCVLPQRCQVSLAGDEMKLDRSETNKKAKKNRRCV
jgi:hypothetical protein